MLSLVWVGLKWRPELNKKLICPPARVNSSCLAALNGDISFFSPLPLHLNWVSNLSAYRLTLILSALLVLIYLCLDWNYTIGLLGLNMPRTSLTFHSLHNCVSQFLVMNFFFLYTYILLIFFSGEPDLCSDFKIISKEKLTCLRNI